MQFLKILAGLKFNFREKSIRECESKENHRVIKIKDSKVLAWICYNLYIFHFEKPAEQLKVYDECRPESRLLLFRIVW